MAPQTRILQGSDRALLDNVAPGVFDNDLIHDSLLSS